MTLPRLLMACAIAITAETCGAFNTLIQWPARIGCAPREKHATTAELDEEQHVEPLQPDRLYGEEMACRPSSSPDESSADGGCRVRAAPFTSHNSLEDDVPIGQSRDVRETPASY